MLENIAAMKMLTRLLIICSCFLPAAMICAEPPQQKENPRIEKNINTRWTFNYFPGDDMASGCESPGYNDSGWPVISLPHTWSTFETTGEEHPYIKNHNEQENPYWWTGWGWYRKRFGMIGDLASKKIFIEFTGVHKYCKVWINGNYLGDHKGGYGSFDFDITDYISTDHDNVIAVAVSNMQNDVYGIPPVASSGMNLYGGIYGNVTLVAKDRLYIPMQGSASHEGGTHITTPVVSEKTGIVRVRTWVKNDYSRPENCVLYTYIIDASGRTVRSVKTKKTIQPGENYIFDQTLKPVKYPHLWSPSDPVLYDVRSEITAGGRVTDVFHSPLGFRWFRWDEQEKSLYINDEKITVNGLILNHEYPWLGSAFPEWISEQVFNDLKENLKCNLLKISHYSASSLYCELADKQGIIVSLEAPQTENQKFSKEVFDQMITEIFRRHRNHPSVLFSDPGNDLNKIAAQIRGVYTHSVLKPISASVTGKGVPSKIILEASHEQIEAEKNSVVVVKARLTDPDGYDVPNPGLAIRWSVEGPATFVGPQIYEPPAERVTLTENETQAEQIFNILRSAGIPGSIRIVASASGVASGSLSVKAVQRLEENNLITEPVPDETGRSPVTKPYFYVSRLEDVPREIQLINSNITIKADDEKQYYRVITGYILKNNPGVDSSTVEFKTLAGLLVSYLVRNTGQLYADDYNFSADQFNNCRLISGYVEATRLPPLFKLALREFYSEEMILRGREKNAGDEMNWLNWIPSGGTVIVSQPGKSPSWPKGTIVTSKTELDELIATVYPVFNRYGPNAKERALTFTSKMNPYIVTQETGSGEKKKIVHSAISGKPILIPLIKFISE